jgi:hypothetical protein
MMDNFWLFMVFLARRIRPQFQSVEPTIGIEPMNLFLTKEALYRLSYVGINFHQEKDFNSFSMKIGRRTKMERETRLELATFSLEG